jgi:hypothetical protein
MEHRFINPKKLLSIKTESAPFFSIAKHPIFPNVWCLCLVISEDSINIDIHFNYSANFDYFNLFSVGKYAEDQNFEAGAKIVLQFELDAIVESILICWGDGSSLPLNPKNQDFFNKKYLLVNNKGLQTNWYGIDILNYLYVSGTFKSGTTWLENILIAGLDCIMLHEGNTTSLIDGCISISEEFQKRSYIKWLPNKFNAFDYKSNLLEFNRLGTSRLLMDFYGSLAEVPYVVDRTASAISTAGHSIFFSQTKIIWIVRHPLDVLVSLLYHELNIFNSGGVNFLAFSTIKKLKVHLTSLDKKDLLSEMLIKGEFDSFFNEWRLQQQMAIEMHDALANRILILRYEDLLNTDTSVEAVNSVFSFLGVEKNNDACRHILNVTDFSNFSSGRLHGVVDASSFYRAGIAGDHKNHFTDIAICEGSKKVSSIMSAFGYVSNA